MALSSARLTPQLGQGPIRKLAVPVAASVKLFSGALIVASGGYAKPGTTATSLIALGVANADCDNSSGSAGDATAEVLTGVFRFDNSATDPLAQADCFADCFVENDHTVAKTNGTSTRSRAGRVIAVDAAGVWVQLGPGL